MRVLLLAVLLAGCGYWPLAIEPPIGGAPVSGAPAAIEPTCVGVRCSGICCGPGHQSAAYCDAAGECAVRCFTGGFLDCDGDPANGCEVAGATDVENCNGCGIQCRPGQHCNGTSGCQ